MATKFLDIEVLNYAIKSLSKQIDMTFLKKSVLYNVQKETYRLFNSATDNPADKLLVVANNVVPQANEVTSDTVRFVTKTPAVYTVGAEVVHIPEVLTPKYDNVIGISDTDLTTIKNDTPQNRKDTYKSNILFVVDDNKLVFYDRDLDTFTDCTSGSSDTTPEWKDNTLYNVGDLVKYNNETFKCITQHTSSSVFTDDSANWITVLNRYYALKQAQYDQLVANGKITDATKDIYIILDANSKSSTIQIVDTLPTPSVDIEGNVYYLNTNDHLYKCIEDTDNVGTYIMKDVSPSGGSAVLTSDLTTNVEVGGVPKDKTYTNGTSLETIVRDILIKYLQPTVTFTPAKDQTFELGYNYTGETLTAVIVKQSNDIQSVKFYQDSTELYSDTSTATTGGTVTYTYSTTNNDTDIKLKCVVDDGVKPVTIERKVSFVRKGFYGTSSASTTPVATSSDVRALSGSILDPKAGSTFTLNIPTGSTLVTIAVPSARTLSSVVYVEGMNSDVKDTFTPSTVNVEGANSYAGIDYTVYSYIPAIPFPNNATYKVTLG